MANLGQITRDIYCANKAEADDLICLKKCSKLVQGCLYAKIDSLTGAKSINLYLI